MSLSLKGFELMWRKGSGGEAKWEPIAPEKSTKIKHGKKGNLTELHDSGEK